MYIWTDVDNGYLSLKHPIYGVNMYIWDEVPKECKYIISFFHDIYHPIVLKWIISRSDCPPSLKIGHPLLDSYISDVSSNDILPPDEAPMARMTFLIIKEMILLGYVPFQTRSYRKKSQRKWSYAIPNIYSGDIYMIDMVKAYKNIILNENICFSTYHPLKWLCPAIIPHIILKYQDIYPSLYKEAFGLLACESWLFYNPLASDHILYISQSIMEEALSICKSKDIQVIYGNVDSLMIMDTDINALISEINTTINQTHKSTYIPYQFILKDKYRKIEVVKVRKWNILE